MQPMSACLSPAPASVGITPTTSPEITAERSEETSLQADSLRKNDDHLQTQAQTDDAFAFSSPTVIRETPDHVSSSAGVHTTPSLEYLFSPPLTRSMARRQSLDVSKSGHIVK